MQFHFNQEILCIIKSYDIVGDSLQNLRLDYIDDSEYPPRTRENVHDNDSKYIEPHYSSAQESHTLQLYVSELMSIKMCDVKRYLFAYLLSAVYL